MKKEYGFEDFRVNEYAYKPISADGRISSYTGHYDINYSSILTRLIQEAGRFCGRFASDLFIDWNCIVSKIEAAEDGETHTFLLGFRADGVDGNTFIFSRYNNYGDSARHKYRSLWRLDILTHDEDEITMYLGRVF